MTGRTRVALGEIVGAHGTRGELRIRWLGDGPDNLLRAPRLAIGHAADDPDARWFAVTSAAPGRGGNESREVRIGLDGIETREAAAALAGLVAIADTASLEPLPPGEHYWYEWIGCTVLASDGRRLGTVQTLWDAGAHDVLVVEDENEPSRGPLLLPVADALLREVDVAGRRIVIEVPEGLLDPVA